MTLRLITEEQNCEEMAQSCFIHTSLMIPLSHKTTCVLSDIECYSARFEAQPFKLKW